MLALYLLGLVRKTPVRLGHGSERRSGWTWKYVAHRHSHSTGPKRKCLSHSGEMTSCSTHTAITIPAWPVRLTLPNRPNPWP
jgi:hypothetical protein